MYFSRKEKLVWFRVPGAGSSSYMRVIAARAPDLTAITPDHSLFKDVYKTDRWKYDDYSVVINLRDPRKWVRTMYTMCYRSSAHWAEYVIADGSHGKNRDDLTHFLSYMLTPFDWITHPKTGEVLEAEVALIEKECLECVNRTAPEKLRKFEMTPEQDSIFQKRFHRELAYYK